MANKPKQQEKDRRARVEEMRRRQQAAERRKTLILVGLAALLALGLVTVPAVQIVNQRRNDPAKKAITSFGVPAAQAGCDAPITDPVAGSGEHVQPGTTVRYRTVPPSSGQHYPAPAPVGRRGFYTTGDRPRVEQLVHNLEHGYTVLWYSPQVTDAQREQIEGLATRLTSDTKYRKFIASAWDPGHGEFPAGKQIALSHWGKKQGYRQFCAQPSGEAVQAFMRNYPSTDSPEPLAG